jgi:hypothetical protein
MSSRVEVGEDGTEEEGKATEGDEAEEDREGEEGEEGEGDEDEGDREEGVDGWDEGGLPYEAGEAVFPTERSPTGNCRASADAGMMAPSCGVG